MRYPPILTGMKQRFWLNNKEKGQYIALAYVYLLADFRDVPVPAGQISVGQIEFS
jgi:hypothetical protein